MIRYHLPHLTVTVIEPGVSKHIQSLFEDMLQCTAFAHKIHPLSKEYCSSVAIY